MIIYYSPNLQSLSSLCVLTHRIKRVRLQHVQNVKKKKERNDLCVFLALLTQHCTLQKYNSDLRYHEAIDQQACTQNGRAVPLAATTTEEPDMLTPKYSKKIIIQNRPLTFKCQSYVISSYVSNGQFRKWKLFTIVSKSNFKHLLMWKHNVSQSKDVKEEMFKQVTEYKWR